MPSRLYHVLVPECSLTDKDSMGDGIVDAGPCSDEDHDRAQPFEALEAAELMDVGAAAALTRLVGLELLPDCEVMRSNAGEETPDGPDSDASDATSSGQDAYHNAPGASDASSSSGADEELQAVPLDDGRELSPRASTSHESVSSSNPQHRKRGRDEVDEVDNVPQRKGFFSWIWGKRRRVSGQ